MSLKTIGGNMGVFVPVYGNGMDVSLDQNGTVGVPLSPHMEI